MQERHFRFQLTDGKSTKTFYYVAQTSDGDIYHGSVDPYKHQNKHSIHASGARHWSYNGEKYISQPMKKLAEFVGVTRIFSMTMGNELLSSGGFGRPYDGKKYDGIILIDTRNFTKEIMISAHLLEPEKMENLNFISKFWKKPQVTIFAQTTPWLAFIVASSDNFRH